MRSFPLTLALCLLLPLPLLAQREVGIPQLTIQEKGVARPLELKGAIIMVSLDGYFAETVFELEFFNDTDRLQEGEFSIQLPPEATVSTYAIDIAGKMRPAVSVEKERARNAYESIKRKMVDPGIVEREANNVYKTRIFPLEAKKSKHVRIGFIQELGKDGIYALPLSWKSPITRFELNLSGLQHDPELKDLTLPSPAKPSPGTWIWTAKDISLKGSLSLKSTLPAPEKPLLRIDEAPDGTRHFVVQSQRAKPQVEETLESWKKVRLIWDSSYSGRFRDHTKEFSALAEIWKWLGNTEVTIQALSTELSPPEKQTITGGDGKAIESFLKQFTYDGAADFSLIEPVDGITLIVSDGAIRAPVWAPRSEAATNHVFLLNSSGDTTAPDLRAFVSSVLDLNATGWLEKLKQDRGLIRLDGLKPDEWHLALHDDHWVVAGKIPAITTTAVRIHGRDFPEIVIAADTPPSSPREEWNLARRIWAQGRLSELEWEGDREAIRRHAIAERLVSDFTSLIVLERMEDHILYEIPPPEPELLIEYRKALDRKKAVTGSPALRAWEEKLSWHKTRFPWLDAGLQSEVAAVAVWVKASRTAFPEDKLNLTALEPFEKWLPGAEEVLETSTKIVSRNAFGEWKDSVKKRMDDLQRIRETNEKTEFEGPVHVSVRGFVHQRGIISANPPLYLREAISKAGGTNHFGSLERVYLYRNGLRTGYNLLSKAAKPVKLQWGDMVVVENLTYDYLSSAADPFADPFSDISPRRALGGGAPVFETPGAAKPDSRTEWREDGNTAAREDSEESFGGTFQPSSAPIAGRTLDIEFVNSLKQHSSPADFYRESLLGNFGSSPVSPATIVETARFFYQNNQKDAGYRILTTLCELQTSPFEATRSLTYWLAAFGDPEKAETLLKALAGLAPDESTRALILLDLGRLTGKRDYFQQSAESDLLSGDRFSLSPIALTDYFALKGNARDQLLAFQANPMVSDIRVVITTSGGTAAPHMISPAQPDADKMADHGGRWVEHPRVSEYQVRRALPGTYQPSLVRWSDGGEPLTVHLAAYIRWGDGQEEKRTETLLMDTTELSLPGVEFGWIDP